MRTPNPPAGAHAGLVTSLAVVLIAPWIIGLCFLAFLTVAQIEWYVPRSEFSLCVGWIGVGLVVDAGLCLCCSRQLGSCFRHLVAEKS